MAELPVNRVLNAFEEAIVLHGVAGASFARIARVGGFHRSLVQHHFKTRERLVEASLDRLLAYYEGRTRQVRASGGLPALLDWMFSPFGADGPPRVARVVDAYQALASSDRLVRERLARLYAGFHEVLLAELELDRPQAVGLDELAWNLVALSFGRAGLDTLGLGGRASAREAAERLLG